MRLLVFLFLIVVAWADVRVEIDAQGKYNVTVDGHLWLRSGRTAIYADDRWYSTDDNSLPFSSIKTADGTDPNLGAWNETQIIYNLVRNQTPTMITARIRQWTIVSAFSFHLDTGDQDLTNRIALDMEDVRTVFPSFYVERINEQDQRGFFTFEGVMLGSGERHAGFWNSSSKVVQSGSQGGPVVLFDLDQYGEGDTLVLSPFSHYMATSLSQKGNLLQYGVMGSMSSVPANYAHAMMLFYSPRGINEAVRGWGQTLQQAYNRTEQNRLSDLTINYLGYYTDNGGYYYYNTEAGMNYETTMINVAHQISLPFHYIQLDSWWYYKGIGDGVAQWTARPDVFPDGLSNLHRRLENIPLAAHNRYWAYDNVYKQRYSFALDVGNGKALPMGNDSFWLDFLTEARGWGLVLYEQDWLNVQTLTFRPTRTDINLGERWLKSMGAAAEQVGINIQYCMSLPRHILQALEIPRVTHARASDDYAVHLRDPKRSTWNIGVTSLFADAVGIAPFKDVLWSTQYQPGAPYGSSQQEILPDREILIATLSTGPVGPGDGIQFINGSRIMKCCRQDGLILKPDRPLTTINALLSDWAQNNGESQGELYSTETMINDRLFQIIFASAMKKDYSVYPSMIGGESGVMWPYTNSSNVSVFDDSHPLEIEAKNCGDVSICLWYISPLWQFNDPVRTKYALLGELNKWTAVSQQRFTSIQTNPEKTQTKILVQGATSEIVPVLVYNGIFGVKTVMCPMSAVSGQATLTINPTNAVCS